MTAPEKKEVMRYTSGAVPKDGLYVSQEDYAAIEALAERYRTALEKIKGESGCSCYDLENGCHLCPQGIAEQALEGL